MAGRFARIRFRLKNKSKHFSKQRLTRGECFVLVFGMENENLAVTAARWVADLMKADGITPAILEAMSEEERVALSLAYFDEVGKKIAHIQTTYLTRTGAREAMQRTVLSFVR